MSKALLGRWVRAVRTQAARSTGSHSLEQGNKQLRTQLARAEMGRNIKKVLTIAQILEAHFHKRVALS